MPSAVNDSMAKLRSALSRTGIFDKVAGVEPSSSPGKGLTAAVFLLSVRPAIMYLNKASALYVYNLRIYTDQLQSPPEKIEELIVSTTDKVLDVFAGDFDIGGTVREIDFMGQFGTPVTASAGYAAVGTNPDSRIVDVIVPLLVDDTLSFS